MRLLERPQAQARRSKKRKAPGEPATGGAPPVLQEVQQQAAVVKHPVAEGPGGSSREAVPLQHSHKPLAKKAKAARAKEPGSQHSGSLAQPVTQRVAERPAQKAKAVLLTGGAPPASPEAAAAQHVRKRPAKKARAAPREPADAITQARAPQPAVQHVLEPPAKKSKTAASEMAGTAPQAALAQPTAQQGAGRPGKKVKKQKVKAALLEQARRAEVLAQPESQQPMDNAGSVPPASLPSAGGSGSAAKTMGFLAALQAATRRTRGGAFAAAQPAAHGQAAQPERADAAGGLCDVNLDLGQSRQRSRSARARQVGSVGVLVGGCCAACLLLLAC